MKRLLWAAIAVMFFAVPAMADDISGGPYKRMQGDIIESDTATQITYDWGFNSNAVRVCAEDDSAEVYMRLGTTDSVTSAAIFTDGQDGTLAGSAAAMFGSGDGTDVNCLSFPVRATAMTFHQATAGTVTLHVQVFGL